MGSFGNIDILYMENLQKDWDKIVEREGGKQPIKFPILMDKPDLSGIDLKFENFSSSPSINNTPKVVRTEEVILKKNKRKCSSLM